MKLHEIAEGYITQKMREVDGNERYFNRPSLQLSKLYQPESGHTADKVVASNTSYPSGVPTSIRKRQYFGLVRRPGTLRL